MVKRLAGDAYDDKVLHSFAIAFGRDTTFSGFVAEFPTIKLSRRTVSKVHDICIDYVSRLSIDPMDTQRFSALRNVAATTVFEILKCIDLGSDAYNSIPWLLHQLGNEVSGKFFVPNRETRELVGDYMYCRPRPVGGIDKGGIRLFLQYGYPRFAHFFQIEQLMDIRRKEDTGKLPQSQSVEAHTSYLSELTKADFGVNDGAGMFNATGGQLTVLSMHPANVRCSLGVPLTKSELRTKPIELVVAGRSQGGSHFSAKAVMFHHSNRLFGKPNKISKKMLAEMLGVKELREAILSY